MNLGEMMTPKIARLVFENGEIILFTKPREINQPIFPSRFSL